MARILCTIVRRHLTVLGACHSTPPSGMKTAHSMPPGGAGVGICAVARNCGAIRCHRMARPSYTQRHRVARLDLAGPAHTPHLPHTSCALTVYPAHSPPRTPDPVQAPEAGWLRPQVMPSHLAREDRSAGGTTARAASWGRPIPAVEWVCKACHGAGPTCGGAKHTCHGAGPMLVLHC